jgi:hypothetical protein
MQPVQLSLLPDQTPTPPAAAGAHLPAEQLAAATALLAQLIARAAQPAAAAAGAVRGD